MVRAVDVLTIHVDLLRVARNIQSPSAFQTTISHWLNCISVLPCRLPESTPENCGSNP